MGYRGMGSIGNGAQGVWGTRGMGNGSHGQWDTGGMGHMGNEAHWGVWAQGVWGTRGMGHVGNGVHGRFAPKISKRCQVVKKMSNVKKSNT